MSCCITKVLLYALIFIGGVVKDKSFDNLRKVYGGVKYGLPLFLWLGVLLILSALFIGCTDDDDDDNKSLNITSITLKVTDASENALTFLLSGSSTEAKIFAIAHYDNKAKSQLDPKYII